MGTRERRQRDLESREQQFVETARQLIHEDGLLNLQMARLAEKCEYAVGTLYQHFQSKEDLLLALTEQDIVAHVALVERVAQWPALPRDRMFALAVADQIFVQRNPEHFRIAQYALCDVVWRAASAQRRQQMLEAQHPIGLIVTGIVESAVRSGDLQLCGMTPAEVAVSIWSMEVGMHNLVHTEGLLQAQDIAIESPYRLMCRSVQTLLNGFGWKPLANLEDGAALDALIEKIRNEVFHDCCGNQK